MGWEKGARHVQLLLIWWLLLWRPLLWRLFLWQLLLWQLFLWQLLLWWLLLVRLLQLLPLPLLRTRADIQVPGHGEQHVRGFTDPPVRLLYKVHLPILPLLLLLQLLLCVLKPRDHLTSSYSWCLHPTSPLG